ncbi:MAG TPA: type II secretion system F family protein, partial [Candidatus Limnocylindria bacterium]|nr:type II secretion system F family protein [Candidatus Limnocylindria bacterium]
MPETTLVLIIAVLAALAVLLITFGVAARPAEDAVQQRLSQLVVQPKSLEEMEMQQPFYERVIRPTIQRLSRLSRRQEGGMIGAIDAKLEKAGFPGGLRGADWVGVKLLALIAFSIGGFLLGLLITAGTFGAALLFALFGGVLGYIAPEFWLGKKIQARSMAMTLQLPDALDLLTISVEAGLGFDAALSKVVEKMEGPLVEEFRQALAEVRMGRLRREALRDVAVRADAQPVTNFIGAIVQAEQLGVPIAKVLQIQSNQLRIERRQRAEEAAAKAPV